MRTLIIGDIHGCFTELQELLEKFDFQKGDQVIAAGDIVGRGQDSGLCLDYLRSIDAVCLLGNHEYWLLREVEDGTYGTANSNCSYYEADSYLEYLKTFVKYYESKDYLVIHAGFNPETGYKHSSVEDLVSLRYIEHKNGKKPWFYDYRDSKHIFFGHWAALGFYHSKSVTCLDGGCVYGNELLGFCPEENQFYSVKAKKPYQEIIYHPHKS